MISYFFPLLLQAFLEKRRHNGCRKGATDIWIVDVVNKTVAPPEVVREPGRINQEGNLEADDITLACLRNRLKKQLTIAQSGNQGTSSCMS